MKIQCLGDVERVKQTNQHVLLNGLFRLSKKRREYLSLLQMIKAGGMIDRGVPH